MTNISIGSNLKDYKKRKKIFDIIIYLFIIIFLGRLAFLQIIMGNVYKQQSESQAIKQIIIEPFRANIFDRNNKLLVHNEPSFTLTITRNDFVWESLPLLSSILQMDTTEIIKLINKHKNFSKFTPVKILKDLEPEKVALLKEYADFLPGIDLVIESKRLYEKHCKLSHVLGYVKEISVDQLKLKQYYRPGDVIGQSGIEYSYEEQLRGSKGVKYIAVNNFGVKVASFNDGKQDIPAVNGYDLYLTIDADLQAKAEELLKGYRGALVAIDPNNGEILALASSPDYNLEDFSGSIDPEILTSLINDPAAPMYNRAIMSRYSPGSTWKMLIAIAGLAEGIIDKNTTVHCKGYITIGSRIFKCHGAHGNVNVTRAIGVSCNVFFYELAMKLGLEKFYNYADLFGFGQVTNIDLPGEKSGFIPNPEWAMRKFKTLDIPEGYLANFGIGQGEVSATPLQMALYTATIANKGIMYQPHLVKYIHNNFTKKIEPLAFDSKIIPIPKHIFDIIHQGMYEVVNKPGGTAQNAALPNIKVCGKTGTAQNVGRDHSWFVAFAPMEKPQIAICVMVENAGFGSQIAAPIAKKIMWDYFKLDTLYKSTKIPVDTSANNH